MEALEAVDDGGGVAMTSDLADGGDACAIDATEGVEGSGCGSVCEYGECKGKGGVGM